MGPPTIECWITAVDQASLLSGYEKIGRKAQLPFRNASNPFEIAQTVLAWLRQEPSWLIIIDNLDDIKVANGLLP